MAKDVLIRPMGSDEAEECESILRSLPNWFGIEESIIEYAKDIRKIETMVALDEATVTGFLTLNQHNAHSAEIHLIAVRQEYHSRGIGRALVEHAEALLRARDIEYFEVKTLGPSRPDTYYDKTRNFYNAMGFRSLEENRLWGDVNPCLIMIKHLACS